jgi:hypothetical protein
MKYFSKSLTAVVIFTTAFFMLKPVYAEEVCDPVDYESHLTTAITESPDLLIADLTDDKLNNFWVSLTDYGLMAGQVQVDHLYIFKSETHPNSVYMFFLRDKCIVDVRMTLKSLVEEMLTR